MIDTVKFKNDNFFYDFIEYTYTLIKYIKIFYTYFENYLMHSNRKLW